MWADLQWVYLGGGNERVRCGVSVVPGSEVSVVGGDDGVLLSLFHIAPETKRLYFSKSRLHRATATLKPKPTEQEDRMSLAS